MFKGAEQATKACSAPFRTFCIQNPGAELLRTGKSPILMGVQGKDPQWAAGASIVRPPCFADRPGRSKNPPGSSRLAPPRHPWWLSRGFDAANHAKAGFFRRRFLVSRRLKRSSLSAGPVPFAKKKNVFLVIQPKKGGSVDKSPRTRYTIKIKWKQTVAHCDL